MSAQPHKTDHSPLPWRFTGKIKNVDGSTTFDIHAEPDKNTCLFVAEFATEIDARHALDACNNYERVKQSARLQDSQQKELERELERVKQERAELLLELIGARLERGQFRKERGELLAALKGTSRELSWISNPGTDTLAAINDARAAIAKAERSRQ